MYTNVLQVFRATGLRSYFTIRTQRCNRDRIFDNEEQKKVERVRIRGRRELDGRDRSRTEVYKCSVVNRVIEFKECRRPFLNKKRPEIGKGTRCVRADGPDTS